MVAADATGLAIELRGARAASSEAKYLQGVNHFADFMTEKGLPQNLFQHGVFTSQQIIVSFIRWLRRRMVWDPRLTPPRLRPIISAYINSLVSHVVKFVEDRDRVISFTLRSPTSVTLLKAYKQTDIIIRGPLDSYCVYPLGCEFVAKTLDELQRRYHNDPATLALYRAVIICEFGWGGRVYEVFDRDQGENPEIAPESERAFINHAALTSNVLLRWSNDGAWFTMSQHRQFPPGVPEVAQLLLAHTKNHARGPEPVAVWANPNGPDNPFCICAALREYANLWHSSMRPDAKLFANARDDVLRYLSSYLTPVRHT